MTFFFLQESESNTANEDDDVSANYLKGSRSPPGISTHLLRSNAAQSPNKNVCSAKKRWLRQAISEDHSDLNDYNGAASPCSETAIDRYIYNIFIFLFIYWKMLPFSKLQFDKVV